MRRRASSSKMMMKTRLDAAFVDGSHLGLASLLCDINLLHWAGELTWPWRWREGFFVTDSARALSDHSLFLLVHSKWKSRKLAGDNCGLVLFAQIFGWRRRASSTKGRKQVWPTQRVGLLLLGCPCFSNFRSVTHEAQARLLDKPMKRLDVASLIVIDCFNDNKPCHVWQIIQASVFQEAWPKQRYIIFPDKWDVSPLLIVFVLLFSSGRRVPRAEWEMSQQTVNFTTSFFW